MKKRVIVISLGGSLIVPDKVDIEFLEEFRRALRKRYNRWKFIIVCGGGSIARKYIEALKKEGAKKREVSLAGIRATRMNALFLIQVFGDEANGALPKDMVDVENELKKNNAVICGALRYADNETSDGTAAKLARHFKCDFINITNVKGLYDKDPGKFRDAMLIKKIGWKEFEKMATNMPFSAGQHFILDQEASRIINKYKIRTYISGRDMKQTGRILEGEDFTGTLISG